MAITLQGNLGVNPTKTSVVSSGLARDTTAKNQQTLSNLNNQLIFPSGSNLGVQPTITPVSGNITGTQAKTKTGIADYYQPPQPVTSSNLSAPSQQVVSDINKTVTAGGYVSPEAQSGISNLNDLSVKENMALSQANAANQQGDARSMDNFLKEYDTLRKSREDAIYNLYSQLQPAREELTTAMTPTSAELETQNQLLDVQSRARQYALETNQGYTGFEGQGRGIPLQLVRGQQKKLLEQRQYGETALQNEETNLLTRLGLQQEARKITSDIATNKIKSITDNADTLLKALSTQDDYTASVLDKFDKLNDNQKGILDDFISTASGLTYDELDPNSKSYVNSLAASIGMPTSAVKDLMTATKNVMVLKQSMASSGIRSAQGGLYNVSSGEWLLPPQSSETGMSTQQQVGYKQLTNKVIDDATINKAFEANGLLDIADQVITSPSVSTNQLKALYTLVKALDPDSAVREGEISLANQAQSYLDTFKTSINKISKGQIISATLAKQLAEATKDLAKTRMDIANKKLMPYQASASGQGFGNEFKTFVDETKSAYQTRTDQYSQYRSQLQSGEVLVQRGNNIMAVPSNTVQNSDTRL